jgi:hypothetical protein
MGVVVKYKVEQIEKNCFEFWPGKHNICKGDIKFVHQTNNQGNIFQCFGGKFYKTKHRWRTS